MKERQKTGKAWEHLSRDMSDRKQGGRREAWEDLGMRLTHTHTVKHGVPPVQRSELEK